MQIKRGHLLLNRHCVRAFYGFPPELFGLSGNFCWTIPFCVRAPVGFPLTSLLFTPPYASSRNDPAEFFVKMSAILKQNNNSLTKIKWNGIGNKPILLENAVFIIQLYCGIFILLPIIFLTHSFLTLNYVHQNSLFYSLNILPKIPEKLRSNRACSWPRLDLYGIFEVHINTIHSLSARRPMWGQSQIRLPSISTKSLFSIHWRWICHIVYTYI